MKNLLLFATLSLLFTSCGGGSSEATKDSSTVEQPKTNQSIFSDPNKLIQALSQNGIGTLTPWKNPMEMGWGSLTPYNVFGPKKDGYGMQNNIAYYLEGTETEVTQIAVNLNINNVDDKQNALKFMSEVVAKTFSSIGLAMPTGLDKAIIGTTEFKAEVGDFIVSNKLEKSNIESWKVIIQKK